MSWRGDSQRLTIEEMYSLASLKGGRCLSKSYQNAQTKLEWECENLHRWLATPNSIQRGSWCPECAKSRSGATQRLNVQDVISLAKNRGGQCFISEYKNTSQKVLWSCAEGHEWFATIASVRKGTWCPECSQGVSERICRVVLENGLGKPFPKIRPKWLVNQDGNSMELDGFSQELQLAFEYNGRQHYRTNKFFHRDDLSLEKRLADDETKRYLCEKNGVKLIVIPYTEKIDGLVDYLYQQVKNFGFIAEREKFTWKSEDVYHSRAKLIELMKAIAEQHGGQCLSSAYVDMNTKLSWKCKQGHEWTAIPSSIQQGVWCPRCSREKSANAQRDSIEDMRNLASKKEGVCISTEYINSQKKLRWKCKYGHQWDAVPFSIKKGHWCPICSKSGVGAKRTIEEFKRLALERGGECLSDTYLGIHSKLKWRCKDGHEWDATPGSVSQGRWCSRCGRAKVGIRLKKTIKEM